MAHVKILFVVPMPHGMEWFVVQLEITVHEEDDNPPYLDQTSYSYTITNDTTAGAKFGNVDATDRDFLPEHRRLTYRTDSR
ncbi:hypothetical protein DPMN_021373 [Dreissena polymorpha]|uniref:Uncharacterized protein n=1 Tax=Dreissena polymorpha TaxID=45954 RepID=A0A9D4NM20_DREPO|nr:hypothetical protein DPMN_021373 [Dreissena polymorpha]